MQVCPDCPVHRRILFSGFLFPQFEVPFPNLLLWNLPFADFLSLKFLFLNLLFEKFRFPSFFSVALLHPVFLPSGCFSFLFFRQIPIYRPLFLVPPALDTAYAIKALSEIPPAQGTDILL